MNGSVTSFLRIRIKKNVLEIEFAMTMKLITQIKLCLNKAYK
jgi:hypothetical protein